MRSHRLAWFLGLIWLLTAAALDAQTPISDRLITYSPWQETEYDMYYFHPGHSKKRYIFAVGGVEPRIAPVINYDLPFTRIFAIVTSDGLADVEVGYFYFRVYDPSRYRPASCSLRVSIPVWRALPKPRDVPPYPLRKADLYVARLLAKDPTSVLRSSSCKPITTTMIDGKTYY